MNNKNLNLKNFIEKKHLNFQNNKNLKKIFSKNIEKIIENINTKKNVFFSFSNEFPYNFKTKNLKKFNKFKNIAIIGMGGSILGSEAICCFLKKKVKKKLVFIDNIDGEKIKMFDKKNVVNQTLFIVISKSGNTVETLSNLLALKIIKKNAKNLIIISEKKENILFSLSNKMNLYHVEHKDYIGGRYSVLSEVGMLPAYLMGLNIKKFKRNLLTHFKLKNKNFLKESSTIFTSLLLQKKFKNLIFLNYSPKLNKFLSWYQQLIAESLGKKNNGFLPVISTAPKDHHSLLQLYMDGPKDKLFYIFSEIKKKDKVVKTLNLDPNIKFLNNKNLSEIKLAQKNALIQALKKGNIPFREIKIKKFNEETLGQLFSYFILETVLIGIMANINPFDQPAVEQVKINTKSFLK